MIKYRRTRKMQKYDQQAHFRGMENMPRAKGAEKDFKRKAYQAAKMIRDQSEHAEGVEKERKEDKGENGRR